MCICYIYIIFVKNSKKKSKKILLFSFHVYIFLRGVCIFFYCGGINSVFKISDFRRSTRNFPKIIFLRNIVDFFRIFFL